MSTSDFYDTLTPYYHLIYADWEAGIERQSRALDAIIRSTGGPQPRSVLDAACGIGTQSLGLAQLGYQVTASDVSPLAVERARREPNRRGLSIQCSVADMRRVDGEFFQPVLVGRKCQQPVRITEANHGQR
jgi:2-polyprenyl-3-methyl-5-hydroxy-6-metoxy-1,4-benzoquinol methylase